MLLTLLLLLAVVLTIPVTGFTNTTQTPDVSSFLRTAFTNLGSAWPENTWQWADAVSNVAGSINGSHLFDGPWTRLKQATTNRTRDSYPPWLQQAADQWAVEVHSVFAMARIAVMQCGLMRCGMLRCAVLHCTLWICGHNLLSVLC